MLDLRKDEWVRVIDRVRTTGSYVKTSDLERYFCQQTDARPVAVIVARAEPWRSQGTATLIGGNVLIEAAPFWSARSFKECPAPLRLVLDADNQVISDNGATFASRGELDLRNGWRRISCPAFRLELNPEERQSIAQLVRALDGVGVPQPAIIEWLSAGETAVCFDATFPVSPVDSHLARDDLIVVSPGVAVATGSVVERLNDESDYSVVDHDGSRSRGRSSSREILLIEHANDGLVRMLSHAAGVVTTSGAITAHWAVIAREYGVPAVIIDPTTFESIVASGDTTGSTILAPNTYIRVLPTRTT